MDDHDQRFKTLLREFLPEFFALFFPAWAARFAFAGTEWLEQEAFLDPPGGEKRVLDVVAKVPTRVPVPDPAGRAADHSLVVIDIEIEAADRAADVRPRMLWYYEHLRRRYALPVVPVCLFLRVGLDGIGWDAYEERFWDHLLLRFEYAYIGLPALDGLPYYRGENLLGVALSALMTLPAADRARIKAEGLARIARSRENAARKEFLAECFDTYLKLDPAEVPEFDRLQKDIFPEGRTVFSTYEERGRLLGKRELLRTILENKFGPLPPVAVERLDTVPAERLPEIALSYTDAKSLKELGLTDE
jgi:hypothetical protein